MLTKKNLILYPINLSRKGKSLHPAFNLIDKVNKVLFLRCQPATKVGEEKK